MDKTYLSRTLAPSAGLDWYRTALRATARQPFALASITFCYLFGMGLLSAVPYFGFVFSALFMPFGSVWIARSARAALEGRSPSYDSLMELMRDAAVRRELIRVGFVFGFVLITCNAVYGILSADAVSQWVVKDGRLDWSSVAAHIPYGAIAAAMLLYIPGLMATWFSPLLVSERRMTWGKSLFYSFFGCVRNILPILVLGIIIGTVTVGITFGTIWLIEALGLQGISLFILTPIAFILSTITYATYWPMFESLFSDVAPQSER
ncbi:MAG TPA: hypothetical protein DEO49_07045 [Sutterella sp.]|jgi:hypothetical protein|nr:hypothetical protein [Sutterella sp.]